MQQGVGVLAFGMSYTTFKLALFPNFFADDTSLYSLVKDPEISARELHDLEVIHYWAKQWKMSFNPDPTKSANEILFSHKRLKPAHPPLFFNGIEVKRVTEHKHLGLILDPLLNFAAHSKEKIAKARKGKLV